MPNMEDMMPPPPPMAEEKTSKTSKTTPAWEATSTWWDSGMQAMPEETAWWYGSKSSKQSKHCKSAKTKSGKSKSAKGCEYDMPIMLWPTYSPTNADFPPQPSLPPKVPTLPPSQSLVQFPTYFPTTEEIPPPPPTLRPTPKTITPFPTGSPVSSPTSSPMSSPTSSPVSPNVPTTLEPVQQSPTYSPTTSWPTWNPTSSTYEPTASSTGTLPTTQRPTVAPSSMGPTVPPLDLVVWGSPLSTSQTGDNILAPLETGIKAVDASAGTRYSIVISSDGTASSTGVIENMTDYDGHLGIRPQNLTEGQNFFQPMTLVFDDADNGVTSAPRFEKAFAGVETDSGNIHTLLIDSSGRAWSTGSNDNGELCLGDDIDRLIPERISFSRKIVDVAVGGEFTLLLDDEGVVWGCGSNSVGQLGLGPEVQAVSEPTIIGLTAPAVSISAGRDHSLIMTSDGYYVMGDNSFGQLCTDSGGEPLLTPRALAIDVVVTEFQAIKFSTFILYEDGSLNSCGRNANGELGDGTNENAFITIVATSDVVTLLGVGPSAEGAFFVYRDGTVWSTGLNNVGQLGVGDINDRNVPTLVEMGNIETMLLSAAEDHTLALTDDSAEVSGAPTSSPMTSSPTISSSVMTTSAPTVAGEGFFFWGDPNSIGEDSGGFNILEPLNIGDGVIDAATGSHYSMIVFEGGIVGSGGFIRSIEAYKGHLGIDPEVVVEGSNMIQIIERVFDGGELVSAPLFQKVFAGVESGNGIHSILLDEGGQAFAVGSNSAGQLCLGNQVDVGIPERIPFENRIVDIAIGGEHTLLLDEFGSVFGCGSNLAGALGLDEEVGAVIFPELVSGVADVSSISSGIHHSLFQAADGIYVSGSNQYGELCSSTEVTEVFVPTKLDLDDGVAENIKQFEAISSSSYILYADGSVSSCGRNNYGQLGDGTNEDASITTVALDGVVRMLGVGPSAESAFFVTEDEGIYGTGFNEKGNLGIGDEENRNIPTRINFGGDVSVSVFATARDHTIAIVMDEPEVPPTTTPSTLKPTTLSSITSSPSISSSTATTVTSSPTKEAGNLPTSDGGIPTYSPTSTSDGGIPTYSPTSTSNVVTSIPTYAPTSVEQPVQTPDEFSNELYYWGSLQSIGGEGQSIAPEGGDLTVADVSAGSLYSVIILPDGSAQVAGFVDSLEDYHGHFGLGNDVVQGQTSFTTVTEVLDENGESIETPVFARAFAGAEQFSSPGSMHTILLDNEGRAYASGSNSKGELCLGDFADRFFFQRIPLDSEVESVAIGNEHTLLLLNDGRVLGCGSNEFGALGLGEDVMVENAPTEIEIEGAVDGISAGLAFSLFKSSQGLFVSGSNSFSQLCFDSEGSDVFLPTPLSLGSSITVDLLTSFVAIQTSSFILFKDGGVAACGQNNFGQLGNGSNEDVVRTLVPIPDNTPIRRLGVGPSALSAFFVNTAGSIYATGLNDRGQLGTGDNTDRNTLTEIDLGSVGGIVVSADQISVSSGHTLSRLSEGTSV